MFYEWEGCHVRIAILGSGAREHAIAYTFKEHGYDVCVIPGNDGMKLTGIPVIKIDVNNILHFVDTVVDLAPDIVVVGPTEYMVAGIVDRLLENGIKVIGATQKASLLESDKVVAKEFMERHGIPTARFRIVHTLSQLERALKSFSPPYVVKVPTLQGGKGSFILPSLSEALEIGGKIITSGFRGMLSDGLVVEEYLNGEEYAVQILISSGEYIILPMVWEYQRLYDGGRGPNTGGMGAVAPIRIHNEVFRSIKVLVDKTVKAMLKEGIAYEGFLYLGVMITRDGAKVLEYNVRLGDPETEVLIPLDKEGFIRMIKDTAFGRLPDGLHPTNVSVAVSLVSEGAPYGYTRSIIRLNDYRDVFFDHVTKIDNNLWVSGWRPLIAVGIGQSYEEAAMEVYRRIQNISFDGMIYRKDIAAELL